MTASSGFKGRMCLLGCLFALACLAPGLLAQRNAGLVGSTAEELEVMDLGGDQISVPPEIQSGGTLRILFFWSTWSAACEREFEVLMEHWPLWSRRGVQVLAINVEASVIGQAEREKVQAYVKAAKLPFPVALDTSLKAFKAYGLVAVPTTIVVGNRGKILMRLSGFPVKASEQMLKGIEKRIRLEGEVAGMPMKVSSLPHRRAVRLIQLSRLLIRKEQWDMAEFSLQKAIREDPKIVEARVALMRLYRHRDQHKLAGVVLKEAKRDFPGDYRLMIEEAGWHYRQKDFDKAKKCTGLALQENPDHVPALVLLGKIEVALEQNDAAMKAFELAMRKNPLSSDPVMEAAKLQEALGEKVRAMVLFEQVYHLLESGLE
jgi:tetratricopeptide (TPR) repeat protein